MKSIAVLSLSIVTILAIALPATAAPKSYPLRVRGGKQLKITTEKHGSLYKLIVQFEPANRRSDAGLRPGQGAWLDRGMRAGEPGRLEYYITESYAKTIIDYLSSPSNYYTFECHNTGKGYMQVTKAYVKQVLID
jgi:hypothetical protein